MTGDRKREYLAALGISLWLPRRPLAGSNHPRATRHPSLTKEGNSDDHSALPRGEELEVKASDSLLPLAEDGPRVRADIDSPPDDWTPPMTDDYWEPVFETAADDAPTPPAASREARIARMDWEELAAEARQCTACGLCATRTQAVFGVGNREADWLVIGEAPGADEDRLGEPFVGRAGKLLNPMLLAIGLKREQAYIANILKCRPPENRDPAPAEASLCRPFLERQIELIRPRIIFALGRIAAQNLLGTDTQIGKLRGRVHRFGSAQIPLVVTYHPAYLLRSPREKRKVWDDLRLARRAMATAAGESVRRPIE